jgi:D-alanyl-lipoteichoic acid acyltransferase DltB (MBOAT superfamily)
LPVGISFFTFQTLSYTIDVYRRNIQPEPRSRGSPCSWSLSAARGGPIVRASAKLPQLRRITGSAGTPVAGITLVVWGYFLKVGVADALPCGGHHLRHPAALHLVCPAGEQPSSTPSKYMATSALLQHRHRLARTSLRLRRELLQALLLHQDERVLAPLAHLALHLAARLHTFLGGSRCSKWKTRRNSFVTFLLGGFWHGAGFTFITWGGLHGLFLVIQGMIIKPYGRLMDKIRCPKVLRTALALFYVFTLTVLTRIFFRAQSMHDAFIIFKKIFILEDFSLYSIKFKLHVIKGLFHIAL